MKYDKKIIGSRIKKACSDRKAEVGKKLTQEKLAEIIHYDRVTVNSWANGRDLVPFDILLRMCDSDIFNCELGYLLGEHEEKTRAATDIVKETNLTGEAVEVLQKYKKSASKREPYPASKFLYPDEFIPALISHMLTSDDFNRLVNRICTQNRKTIEYAKRIDVERKIIRDSYKAAQDHLGSDAATDISLLREQYQKEVERLMLEKKDGIVKNYPYPMAEGFYEEIYVKEMQRTFDLAWHTSEEVIEMNNFLNQKDMFSIVSKYMESITKYRKEVEGSSNEKGKLNG